MRILFISYAITYPWRGGRTLEGRLADTLAKTNEVTLCSEKPPTYLEDEKCLFKRNIVLLHAKDPKFTQRDLQEIQRDEYDVMVISSPSSAPFAAYVKKKLNLPLCTEVHDIPTWRLQPCTTGFQRYRTTWAQWLSGVVQSDIVFACHNVVKTHLLSLTNYPEERVRVVYHGVDSEMADKVPPQEEENSISFCARLTWYKGVDYLIRAATMLKDCPKLKIIGDGPELQPLKHLASRYRVNAEFLGAIDDIQKFTQFKRSKFHVYPSISMDIGGLAPMEASLCKKPSIVFDQPVNREIFQTSCEYVRYKSARDLVKIMAFYDGDEEFRRAKGLWAHWFVRRYRTLKVQAEKWIEIMEELV